MRRWRSTGELHDIVEDIEEREQLFKIYGLSLFCAQAFLKSDFAPSPSWQDCVKITDHGAEYLQHARDAGIVSDNIWETFALFQLFYHFDLFIDHVKTDQVGVVALLNQMQQEGNARWPYVFGNTLYQKFNDWPDATKTDHLDPPEVQRLLDGTPHGVFQVGSFVSGPMGLVQGKEERLLPPTLKVLLWHCSDPGCRAAHLVQLRKYKSKYQRYRDAFARHILDHFGPSSEWHLPILYIHRIGKWPNDRPYYDLPALIGDCIIGTERTNLLTRALKSEHHELLVQILRPHNENARSSTDLATGLPPEGQHQALLMLPDYDLVRFIDELVAHKEIRIPPAELRARKTYVYGPDRDTKSSLSSLGMRSCAHPAVLELASAVWSTYESLGQNDDLLWRLRGQESISLRHAVLDFIRVHGPEQTVQDLIFPSKSVTTAVAEKYNFHIFPAEDERDTTRRLLWKLGFNLSR
jgi:hypothetical protein